MGPVTTGQGLSLGSFGSLHLVDPFSDVPAGTDFERGGFWRRALALTVDLIIVCLMLQMLAFVAYPITDGRVQFKDGLAFLTCTKLDKVPDGIKVPADFAPTSVKVCRQGLFGLTAARIVTIQHGEQHGVVTTIRQIIAPLDEADQPVKGTGLDILFVPLLFGFRLLLDLGGGTPGRRLCRVRLFTASGEDPPRAGRTARRHALQAMPCLPIYAPALAGLFGFVPTPDQVQPIVIGSTVCLLAGLGLALNAIIYRRDTYYDRFAGIRVLRVDIDGVAMPAMGPAPSLLPPEIAGPPALPMEDDAARAPAIAMPPPLPPSRNYLMRHWRGECSLPFAFWVNGMVLGFCVGFVVGLGGYFAAHVLLGRAQLWFASNVAVWLWAIAFSIWQIVGIWRSATRYRQSEKYVWGGVAKAFMVLAALNLGYRFVADGVPQLRDAYHGDPYLGRHSFHVADNGNRLEFYGGITFGVAREFEEQLAGMDHVTTVLLNSQGGRILEAQKMSDLIKARGLSTSVTNACLSACTIVLLGGKERTIAPTAKIGFHQPTFVGVTDVQRGFLIAQEESRLQRFGLSKDFAERANQAAPTSMWYPDKAELLREHVVTAIIDPKSQPKMLPNPTDGQIAIGNVPVRATPATAPPVAPQWQPSKSTDAPKPIATLPVQAPPATTAPVATMPPTPATTSAPRASIPAELIERLSKQPPPKRSANTTAGAQK